MLNEKFHSEFSRQNVTINKIKGSNPNNINVLKILNEGDDYDGKLTKNETKRKPN